MAYELECNLVAKVHNFAALFTGYTDIFTIGYFHSSSERNPTKRSIVAGWILADMDYFSAIMAVFL
jgi:hypothetical protein